MAFVSPSMARSTPSLPVVVTSRRGAPLTVAVNVGGTERAGPSLKVILTAGRTDHHKILKEDRRHRERFAVGGGRHMPGPEKRSGFGIEREQVAVRRAANDAAVFDRDAPIARPAA